MMTGKFGPLPRCVDRIGQQSGTILCYSFLPAKGVERIIRLRERVRQRLAQNAEVVGADEAFFEYDRNNRIVIDLYNEKADILDGDADTELDLASYTYQIWKNATAEDPKLEKILPAYTRLKRYAEEIKGILFESPELLKAIDDIYRYPLRSSAVDTLNRQLRSGVSDETLAQLVIALRSEDRLCIVNEEEQSKEPQIICSLGIKMD